MPKFLDQSGSIPDAGTLTNCNEKKQLCMFGNSLPKSQKPKDSGLNYYDVLPVSVIECAKSEKKRRDGNKDFNNQSSRAMYSEFWPEAATLAYQHWLRDCKLVADPFAGWGERHHYAKENGITYKGFDLSPEAIEYAKEEYGVENTLADSMGATLEGFDGLLTCPPYWNLELYSDNSRGGDRIKTWSEFKSWYAELFRHWYEMADAGAWFVIVTGNWRMKKVYYDLDYWTRHCFSQYGAEMKDSVILSRRKISKIKIMMPQAKEHKYSVNVHETMNVFRKPAL